MEAYSECSHYGCDLYSIIENVEDKGYLIQREVDKLDKQINLYHYDAVIMPETRNRINEYMMRYIYRFNQPRLINVEELLSDPMNPKTIEQVQGKNTLIIDDGYSAPSTPNAIISAIRKLNQNNQIAIFSLIGHNNT